jgi:hypothetical protein
MEQHRQTVCSVYHVADLLDMTPGIATHGEQLVIEVFSIAIFHPYCGLRSGCASVLLRCC